MIHLLVVALCLTGFTALALAMDRQHRDLFGRGLRASAKRSLRILGTAALLLALGLLAAWQGWGLGLVMFSGHTTLAAGTVYCALIALNRTATARVKRR